MFKRLFMFVLLIALVVVSLVACDSETSEPVLSEDESSLQNESHPPIFFLEVLPELEPFEAPREIVSRYHAEKFVDTLKPANDYGRLYPYEGKFVGDQIWECPRYGLTDAGGRIVVDPVYGEAYYAEPANGGEPEYLILAYPVEAFDKEAQKPVIDADDLVQPKRFVFAAIDGSWVSDTYSGKEAELSEDRIIIYDYVSDRDLYLRKKDFRIYDFEGRLIAQGDGALSGFQEGLSAVRHVVPNEQNDHYQIYYDYIDKNGKVVIPGPFTEAEGFVNGFANVVIAENEHRVIDTDGNIRSRSRPGGIRYDYWGDYICFTEYTENTRCGILAKNGDVIIDNQYSAIWPASGPCSTFMVGTKGLGRFWILDPQSGEEKRIDLAGVYIDHADICGNNWCEVSYEKNTENGKRINGFALLKGGLEYQFDSDDKYRYCSYITGDLFALNFSDYSGDYAQIFDAATGKVIENRDGFFNYKLNDDMLVFSTRRGRQQLVCGPDFQPVFSTDDLGGGYIIDIQYLADDIYRIRTNLFSGLIKENGQWLIRVYANSTD